MKLRKFFLLTLERADGFKKLSVRQSCKTFDPHIDPYLRRSRLRRDVVILCLYADIPLLSATDNGNVFYRTDDILTFPISHPANFRQPNLLFDLIEFNSLRKTNRVMSELLLVFRKIGPFFEEIGVRPIKIF